MINRTKIVMIGCGYVGLITALGFAYNGKKITCLDNNEEKINNLNKGISPIYEPGINDMLKQCQNKMTFTTDYKKALNNANIIFIAVNTPEKHDGSADLTYLYKAIQNIASNINNDFILIIKSTVPVGTTNSIYSIIKQELFKYNKDISFNIAFLPEFLSEGSAINDVLNPKRLVFGLNNNSQKEILLDLYSNYNCPKLFMDINSAEMSKYASNCFLALKISYINEIANLCEKSDSNIKEVTKVMALDERIGEHFLNAGIGYGGSCFPKDTKALISQGNAFNIDMATIKAAVKTNNSQSTIMFQKANNLFKSLKNVKIAILGITFKANTDDLKNASSLENIKQLIFSGAHLKVFDPKGTNNLLKILPSTILDSIEIFDNIQDALYDTEACFIFTEWKEIKNIKKEDFVTLMKKPIIFDGRNIFDKKEMMASKIKYYGIGV